MIETLLFLMTLSLFLIVLALVDIGRSLRVKSEHQPQKVEAVMTPFVVTPEVVNKNVEVLPKDDDIAGTYAGPKSWT